MKYRKKLSPFKFKSSLNCRPPWVLGKNIYLDIFGCPTDHIPFPVRPGLRVQCRLLLTQQAETPALTNLLASNSLPLITQQQWMTASLSLTQLTVSLALPSSSHRWPMRMRTRTTFTHSENGHWTGSKKKWRIWSNLLPNYGFCCILIKWRPSKEICKWYVIMEDDIK
jgi:hypothetical protein